MCVRVCVFFWGVGEWDGVVGRSGHKPLLFLTFVLYLFLTRVCTKTSPVCSIQRCLPCSVNLICPAMLPPTSLHSLILSCPFLSLSFSFLFQLYLFSPQWTVSLSHSAEQWAWVRLKTSLQWMYKYRASGAVAGWREERREIEIKEFKRENKETEHKWKINRWAGYRVVVGVGDSRGGVLRMWTIRELTICRAALIKGGSTHTVICCYFFQEQTQFHHNGQSNHPDLAQIAFASVNSKDIL